MARVHLDTGADTSADHRNLIQKLAEHDGALDALEGGGTPSVNVLKYGAIGNGVADDSVAIRNAMAAAAALGQAVFFPAGTYLVNRDGSNIWALTLPGSGMTLTGEKGKSWIKLAAGQSSTPLVVLHVQDIQDITIQGLGIDGNWGNSVGFSDSQAGLNHATQGDPKNHGMMIRGATNTLVQDCLIKQAYGDGIWLGYSGTVLTNFSIDVEIRRVNIDMCSRNGITIQGENLTIRDCVITNVYSQAIDSEPVDVYIRDVVVEGCDLGIWWNTDRGVANSPLSIVGGKNFCPGEATYARGYRIRHNLIRGCVLIQDAVDVIVEDNRIVCDYVGPSYAPVLVQMTCDDIHIVNNYIFDRSGALSINHDASIYVRVYGSASWSFQPAGVEVRGNQIHARNGRAGITIDGTGGGAFPDTGPVIPNQSATGTALTSTIGAGYNRPLEIISLNATSVVVNTTQPGGVTINWSTNQWVGYAVRAGLSYAIITGNTVDTLTFSSWFNGLPANQPVIIHPVLTASGAAWTQDQFTGWICTMGGVRANVLFNTATQLVLYVPITTVLWSTPTGVQASAPTVGTLTLTVVRGAVEVIANHIDCGDDGAGAGSYGISLSASRAGLRARLLGNVIRNANVAAINIAPADANRALTYLEIADNYAFDDQISPTCLNVLRFTTSSFLGSRLVLRNNFAGDGVAGDMTGLTTGTWRIHSGKPSEWAGFGSPESVVTAPIGSYYHRLDGGAGTCLYIKESGTGNTGWIAK